MYVVWLCCLGCMCCVCFFFFKQKTAYEMRIRDWSSDVCSSDPRRDRLAWVLGHGGDGLAEAPDAHRLRVAVEPHRGTPRGIGRERARRQLPGDRKRVV